MKTEKPNHFLVLKSWVGRLQRTTPFWDSELSQEFKSKYELSKIDIRREELQTSPSFFIRSMRNHLEGSGSGQTGLLKALVNLQRRTSSSKPRQCRGC